MKLKKHNLLTFKTPFFKWVAIFCTLLSTFLLILLVREYRYFHRQADTLCILQEDYRNYTASLKKILNDYNKTKERLELIENFLEEEKKKPVGLEQSKI